MDPLRLLSRSTKFSKGIKSGLTKPTPSSGPNSAPQLFSKISQTASTGSSKKRKRDATTNDSTGLDFFGLNTVEKASDPRPGDEPKNHNPQSGPKASDIVDDACRAPHVAQELSLEEKKEILRKHKLKVTWLNPPVGRQKARRKISSKEKLEKPTLYPSPLESFPSLKYHYNLRDRVTLNIDDDGYKTPTEVQVGALPLLLAKNQNHLHESTVYPQLDTSDGIDLLTVAPTGSGKTLAFLIPLVHDIVTRKQRQGAEKRAISAIILAPTKELAGQIVNEGRKLADGTGLRITQARKGMRLSPKNVTTIGEDDGEREDEPDSEVHSGPVTAVKSDIIVSTPGTLDGIVRAATQHDPAPLSTVRYLVLDEADVLLDPLFREQTLAIWNALPSPHLRVSLWSATMGSNIEELARAQIDGRRSRLPTPTGEKAPAEAPLIRLVVGLKDSAVPNVHHRLTYAASEQGKLLALRQILHPTAATHDAVPSLTPPFLVFTQTIERAVALHAELLYDIPPEAGGGLARIAVLHADLSDAARDRVMAGFRRGEIWVLITTDLLARGVDFRGVNGVVNYDIPTSSAAYVHRAGRTGRAGRAGGVAITLYTRDDIPYVRGVANVVAAAQRLPGAVVGAGEGDDGVQPWLLEALPSLSKRAKKELKMRGVEARTARGRETDPKAARRARISTKAGFVRREENRRKGAIMGAQRRQRAEDEREEEGEGDASGSDFGGFD